MSTKETIVIAKIFTTHYAVRLPGEEAFLVNSDTIGIVKEILNAKKTEIDIADIENPEINLNLTSGSEG
jgi:hypothetical protein